MTTKNSNFREDRANAIADAKHFLDPKFTKSAEEYHRLAKRLKGFGEFGYARKLLARARRVFIEDPTFRFRLLQEEALCTYKDSNLPLIERLNKALEILSQEEDLNTTRNQETLGLAGAIHKRKWEADGQKQNLEHSLAFYLRGYKEDPRYDLGYTGINAAYVLDQLAALEGTGETVADVASERRTQATDIRRRLVEFLPELIEEYGLRDNWWVYVTIAEAYFGLKDYGNARQWLDKAKELQPEGWQFESTARQLVNLALLQLTPSTESVDAWEQLERSDAGAVLREFLSGEVTNLRSLITGKIGLALAGGGFRASLFHIGVLAKLAELDVLRNVEVLSCVSGGAIVGAHYYLELRKLLESKADDEITREDYISLVQRLEHDFRLGVQRNLRMRTISSLINGLKSAFSTRYSRSERLGRLFETELFSRVDGDEHKRLFLNELLIQPKNASDGFTPNRDNWRRCAKVPTLILNATTLNTGHNWQFTASWMGESSASVNRQVDTNSYLRTMYYSEAPKGHQQMPLGRAVAACAAVPGLCEPIVLTDLYPDITVRLVDGAVHGCEGVTALLEQDCSVLLVCDASGEMETQPQPGSGMLDVPLRSLNMALMQTRSLLYENLRTRREGKLLRGFMYLHLSKDLHAKTVNWIGSDEPVDESNVVRLGQLTSYGIRKDVQASLAAIRTDFDSFSDVEASALMVSGYRMTEYEFPKSVQGFPASLTVRPSWRFLAIEEAMKRAGSVDLISGTIKLLKVASDRGFKIWRLSRMAQLFAILFFLAIVGIVVYLATKFGNLFTFELNLGRLLWLLIAVSIPLLVTKIFLVIAKSPKTVTEILIDVWLVIMGFLAAQVYLAVLDPLYLQVGVMSELPETPPMQPPVEQAAPERGNIFTKAVSSTQNIGNIVQQSRPVQALGKLVDQADPTTTTFVGRSLYVETLCKLFETSGYQALRFPRTEELNPLNINLDFIARKNGRYLLAEVKTKAESTTPIDWQCAIELEVAMQALKAKTEKQRAQDADSDRSSAPSIETRALLILVDVAADPSLENFVEGKAIKIVSYSSDQMSQIFLKTGQLLAMSSESRAGGLVINQAKRDEQTEALWMELKTQLELMSGVEETRIQTLRATSVA